ncbi:MAG: TPM domain-containing protein [Herbinix sp.]|nr:TPM domain-containing protein [Herbinix sp.]
MVLKDNRSRNMVKHIGRLLFCLALILTAMLHLLPNNKNSHMAVYASSNEAEVTESAVDDRRVYDEAGLLDTYETQELEDLSHEYGERAGIEIYVLTNDDKNATNPEKYIEDFEDQLPVGDRVYFLYDSRDSDEPEIFMEGFGLAETYIHSKRVDKIFDNVADYLKNDHYYDAFKTYIIMSANYMEDDSELNYDHNYRYDSTPEGFDPDNEYSYDEYDYQGHYDKEAFMNSIFINFWFQLVVALIIGGIVVGALAYRSSGRMTAGARDYLDRSRGGLIGRRDQYIRSSVTRWRKPQQNSSSGGGRGGFNSGGFRGGISGGGRSHSSGGRKL